MRESTDAYHVEIAMVNEAATCLIAGSCAQFPVDGFIPDDNAGTE